MNATRWACLSSAGILAATLLACSSEDSSSDASQGDGGAGVGGAATGGASESTGGTGSGGVNAGGTATGGASSGGAGTGGNGTGGDPTAIDGWTLVWNDEFDGPAGQGADPTKWNVDTGPNLNNNEKQYYTNRPENSGLDGEGNMLVTARKEEYSGYHYTSAKFTTWGKFTPTYGRIEARIKLPRGQGMWPAFWALGTDIGDVGWPECGEIDIMEAIGSDIATNHGSLHGPGYSGGNPLSGVYSLENGDFADDFHVFAVEWEENVVRWYVDNNLFETRTSADVPGGNEWVYDHSFFLILNVAVGGNWPGDPDDSIFPQTMTVDYVRAYSR